MSWAEVGSHFPALERFVSLDTAGGGPMCREAWEAARSHLDALRHSS